MLCQPMRTYKPCRVFISYAHRDGVELANACVLREIWCPTHTFWRQVVKWPLLPGNYSDHDCLMAVIRDTVASALPPERQVQVCGRGNEGSSACVYEKQALALDKTWNCRSNASVNGIAATSGPCASFP